MKNVLPFEDNNYWRVALVRAITSTWDDAGDANWSLHHLYKPEDEFEFETHESRYYVKVSVLTPDFIKELFDIHERAMVDHQLKKERAQG